MLIRKCQLHRRIQYHHERLDQRVYTNAIKSRSNWTLEICHDPFAAGDNDDCQELLLLTWYLDLGTWYLVPSSWYLVLVIDWWTAREAWWLIDRLDAYRPKGRGFESCSSRHVRTLAKSFARSCLWRFSVKLRHCIRAVSGAPLSIRGLEEAL